METKLFDLVTITATKPSLNNMRKWKVEFLRKPVSRNVVVVKLLELTQFASLNIL